MSNTPIDNLLRAAAFTEAVTTEMVLAALAQAWQEGSVVGYDYGRKEERYALAYAPPENNPYIPGGYP